ncbi:MAG: PAS domain S-box protein [bacterium]
MSGEGKDRKKTPATSVRTPVPPIRDINGAAGLPEASQDRLRMLECALESSLNGIGITDLEGTLVYVNDSLVQMWGYDHPRELVGRQVLDFWVGDGIRSTLKALRKVGAAQGTDIGKRKDGGRVEVQFHAALLANVRGEPAYMFGSFIDISELCRTQCQLQESEAAQRDLIAAVPGMVYKGRPDWSIEIVSPHCEPITGYTIAEFETGAVNWIDIIHPGDRATVLREAEPDHHGALRLDQEYRILKKDGDIAWVRDTKNVHFERGTPLGASGVVVDITARKRMEEQLTQADRLASVGLMAAGVAHEMNNPLSVLLGYVSLVNEIIAALPLEVRRRIDGLNKPLQKIEKTGRRCKRIIEDLLSFAQPGELEVAPVDLNEAIRSSLSFVELQLRNRHVEVVESFAETVDVIGNSHRLKLVFSNLILNAIQSMQPGGTLRLETAVDPTEPPQGIARISDDGVGIASANLRRIFDPFFTTKPVGEGTGLGLSIVYGIMEQHRGSIRVDSEPGQGTTIELKLPLADR